MIDGVRLKFCGLKTLVDAEFADKLGADYLGFILHPKSPRYLSLRDFANLRPNLPEGRKMVAVMVQPDEAQLAAAVAAGFDRFQIHFDHNIDSTEVAAWSELVGKSNLWLAPKRPQGLEVSATWLDHADTLLVDTFNKAVYGGSGETGDWTEFADLQQQNPKHTWVLAGGLSPDNMAAALDQSGAKFVDVNSGVELSPGVKDHAKMKAVVLAIHEQRTKSA